MGRVVTQADVDGIAPGGTLTIAADATMTPLAEERARQRGVRIERRPSGAGPTGAARTAGRGSSSAPSARGPDREVARAVTRAVVDRLGNARPQVVESVVAEVMAAMGSAAPAAAPFVNPRGVTVLPVVGGGAGPSVPSVDVCLACVEQEKARRRSRAVLTATGRNTKGIVASVTSRIAELGGDILDISQTLVSDFFTMIIVIDVGSLTAPFERFQAEVTAAVSAMGCQAMMMHEDVLTSLHRV